MPPPKWSDRLYVRLRQAESRLFRDLLEGYDNLAMSSVVDRKACIFKLTFSPHQGRELRMALAEMRQSMEFEIIEAFTEN